jgi:branched-chain amino acid transport system permease protein
MTRRRRVLITLTGLAAVLAGAIVLPYLTDRFIVSVMTLALIFALLALSINLLGYAGLASLGHAGIMAVAAYALAVTALETNAGFVVQAVVGIGFGLLAAILFGLLSMRTSGVYFLMATLALGMVVWGLSIRLTSVTGGENGLRGLERPAFAEPYWGLYYLVLGVLAACLVALWVITKSPFGLALKGLRENETRIQMLGYNPAFIKIYAFALSGIFAGIAGILYAYYNRFVSPSTAGFLTSGKAVLMVILGGIGTLAGPIIGAIIITFVENVVSLFTARWPTVLGLLYIISVLFARDGIAGLGRTTWSRLSGGKSSRVGDGVALKAPAEVRRE